MTVNDDFVPSFLNSLPVASAALDFAREHHRGQRRESDAAPFIAHPLEVASLLYNTGHGDYVVAAGILHDVVEDTGASAEEVTERFGGQVGTIVAAMTEDDTIEPFEGRKEALRAQIARSGAPASAVYAADKVAKVRELRARVARGEALLDQSRLDAARKLDHYENSLEMLEAIAADHPLVRQLRFELELLAALPPASTAEPRRGGQPSPPH